MKNRIKVLFVVSCLALLINACGAGSNSDAQVDPNLTASGDDGDGVSVAEESALQTDPNSNDILFVSKGGTNASDDNPGTIAAPFLTIDAAIAKAALRKFPITLLVSAETYDLSRVIEMTNVFQIVGGYSLDFGNKQSGKTVLNFSAVTDQTLIHIKPTFSDEANIPITLQNLSIHSGGRSDYFFAVVFENSSSFIAAQSFNVINNEIQGNIAVNKPGVKSLVINDNVIHGADGGLLGTVNTNGVYNVTIFDCCKTGIAEIKRNQIFGGTNLGEKMFQVQNVINLMSAPGSSTSNVDISITLEDNLLACGQAKGCVNVESGINFDSERKQSFVINNNTFTGVRPPEGTTNSSFTAFTTMWDGGDVQFTNNEIYFPDVKYAYGFQAYPLNDASGKATFLVKANQFSLDYTTAIFATEKSVAGISLANVAGSFELLENNFGIDNFGIPVQRTIYESGNPKESATINSDVEVVEAYY